MKEFFLVLDDFLRGRGIFSPDAPLYGRLKWLFILLFTSGVLYGVVMGTFSGLTSGRFHQLIYSGVKVPLLLIVTFVLCLPSFLVLNTVAGLRDDFGQALRAVVATQSGVTVVLA
jgi:spore maturation protein SpmA